MQWGTNQVVEKQKFEADSFKSSDESFSSAEENKKSTQEPEVDATSFGGGYNEEVENEGVN